VLPAPALKWEAGLARRPARLAHTWVACCVAAAAVLVVGFSWNARASRLGWQPLPESVVAAVDACPGNLYNRYDDGGFFIWFTPAQRVFLDGRQDPYPVQLIQDHRATETAGAYRDTFRRFGIRCAALPSSSVTAATCYTPAGIDGTRRRMDRADGVRRVVTVRSAKCQVEWKVGTAKWLLTSCACRTCDELTDAAATIHRSLPTPLALGT
jgi:hypothetical protein